MKTNTVRTTNRARHRRATRQATFALLTGLVLAASATYRLQAEVISNFDTATWTWEDDPSEAVTFVVTDGQLRIGAEFGEPTNPAAVRNTFAGAGWTNDLPLIPGHTLEVRVDLVSVGLNAETADGQ
jgi:hypothetical protein